MVLDWIKKETKSQYLARPAEHARDLIYLHPDKSIPRSTKLTVRSDECAVFFREGRFVGKINPGTVLLDTANIPFLGHLLVDQFTDGNHFLCELFYVSLNETTFEIPGAHLGQYKDKNSANLVAIEGRLSYTVRISDPVKVITELGGQNASSEVAIERVFNGRIINQLRKAVGARIQRLPVLDVVSNADAEAISEEVRRLGHDEFTPLGIGIGRVYDLMLSLDAESERVLQQFGLKEAELELQAKGARLATKEGFAEFNLVQGQRAALEGLGKGLGTGGGPMIMSGMNLGANLTGSTRSMIRPATPTRSGPLLGTQSSFLLRTDSGDTGPYSPRQLALLAISKGMALAEMQIRAVEDPEDVSFSADLEPQIVAEHKRRAPAPTVGGGAKPQDEGFQAFDLAFNRATRDGQLSPSDMGMLSSLAVALGVDGSIEPAEARIRSLAQLRNIRIL